MTSKLNLDQGAVLLARELARRAGEPVTQLALTHTTVSIERAVLRLGGLDGADRGGMPWVNRLTRAMRAALDRTSRELGRYVRLTSYASGLCMPEITTLAGLERLDMMLSDCMHGIIVRDINPLRTFIDQRFSRAIGARAGIVASPGEEDFLAPAPAPAPAAHAADCSDAADGAAAVIASQLLNEYFGREAGLETWQLGFGHGLEINPAGEDSFLLELAQAQLVRELFPGAPLKYMPPSTRSPGTCWPAACSTRSSTWPG